MYRTALIWGFGLLLISGLGVADIPTAQAQLTQIAEDDRRNICIDLARIRRTEVVDDNTILFYLRGGDVYVNELTYRCPGLGFEDGFSYTTSLTKLCSNKEIIRVLDRGTACGLGTFTKIDKATARAILAGEKLDPSRLDDGGAARFRSAASD